MIERGGVLRGGRRPRGLGERIDALADLLVRDPGKCPVYQHEGVSWPVDAKKVMVTSEWRLQWYIVGKVSASSTKNQGDFDGLALVVKRENGLQRRTVVSQFQELAELLSRVSVQLGWAGYHDIAVTQPFIFFRIGYGHAFLMLCKAFQARQLFR